MASIASLSAHLVAYRQCVISLAAPGVSKLIAPLARGEAQRYCHPAREKFLQDAKCIDDSHYLALGLLNP